MSLFGDSWVPRRGVFGEEQQSPASDARLAFASSLLAGSGGGSNFAEIMGKALLASREARQQTQQQISEQNDARQVQELRQAQMAKLAAEQEAASKKLDRVDLGDAWGLLDVSGNLVAKLPKGASPDTMVSAGVTLRGQDMSRLSAIGSDLTARYGIDKAAATALAGQIVQMRGQDMSAESEQAKIVATTGKQKAPTEYDRKALLLFNEMKDAAQQYKEAKGADTSSLIGASLNASPITRPLTSSGFKQHEAAGLRWAQNFLYLKSGQAAPAEEVRKTFVQYLPQPGDSTDVKAQKEVARQQALENVAEANGIDYSPDQLKQDDPWADISADVQRRAGGYYDANSK